jgi:hypothetical protein
MRCVPKPRLICKGHSSCKLHHPTEDVGTGKELYQVATEEVVVLIKYSASVLFLISVDIVYKLHGSDSLVRHVSPTG